MKKVLILTYYFPPRPSIASIRLRGLAKYLPEFGWEPVILTAALPGTPDKRFHVVQTHYPGDATYLMKKKLHLHPNKGLQEQLGITLSIREGGRSFVGKITKLINGIIAYPDEQKAWYPIAVKKGIELLQNESFNAIISSSGPVTSHIIAKTLKQKFRIPWLADFRDLWTQNHCYTYGFLRKFFEQRLEIKTLIYANALVTVSLPLADKLRSLHRMKSVFGIPNGFDPDEIKKNILTKEFTITYTGSPYMGKQDQRPLFKVLSNLIERGLIDSKLIKVRFFGRKQYWLEQYIMEYHLESIVKQYGMFSREVALEKQRESQVLLLLNWNDPREQGLYSGKIFEYLAAKRPILAIGGPKGVVSDLLDETEAGNHVSDVENIKNIILKYYMQFKTKGSVEYTGKEQEINKYTHIKMAEKFANIMNSLSKGTDK
jgi:glycosyltransferase involved in cell wall biosynthesis